VRENPVSALPEGPGLSRNYPNPFNGSTVIQYRLNQKGNIRLSVFDMNGRLVRMLWNGIQSAGVKQAVWDGKDASGIPLPSGLYFSRLEADDGALAGKMVLQK
jgi:flagellar hook assembly protein FlgD